MIKGSTFLGLNSLDDFKIAMATTSITYVASGTPTLNQWTYDTTLRAIRINKDNTKTGYVTINIGFLDVGDTVELQAEFMNVSGTDKGTLTIDHFAGTSIGDGTKTSYYTSSKTSDGFELTNYTLVVTKAGYYRATFGMWGGMVGDFYMRNCACRVQSVIKGSDTNVRFGMFRKMSTGEVIQRLEFGGTPCTVTITNGNEIKVTWDRPLTGLRPIGFVSNEFYIENNKYMARCSSAYQGYMNIRFYPNNPYSDTPVNIADLPTDIHFSVFMMN